MKDVAKVPLKRKGAQKRPIKIHLPATYIGLFIIKTKINESKKKN